MKFAIIGAGMAGLACAERLSRSGHAVRLFDKGRGPGGRMSTRRVERDGRMLHFDHGAQYFTARDPRFAARVKDWQESGVVARWPAAGSEACVGVPGMNAPVKAMAEVADVRFGARVEALRGERGRWRLDGEDCPDESYDGAIVAVPAEQAGPLVRPLSRTMAALADGTRSQPCWTLMARFAESLPLDDTVRETGAIGWAARNSAKPGREGEECWVVQASPEWSEAHLEETADTVVPLLLSAFAEASGVSLPDSAYVAAHRWRYAMSGSAGEDFLWDARLALGACGDWLIGPRIESAWLSGTLLAEHIAAEYAERAESR